MHHLHPVSQYVDRPNLFGVKFANGEMLVDSSVRFLKPGRNCTVMM